MTEDSGQRAEKIIRALQSTIEEVEQIAQDTLIDDDEKIDQIMEVLAQARERVKHDDKPPETA